MPIPLFVGAVVGPQESSVLLCIILDVEAAIEYLTATVQF